MMMAIIRTMALRLLLPHPRARAPLHSTKGHPTGERCIVWVLVRCSLVRSSQYSPFSLSGFIVVDHFVLHLLWCSMSSFTCWPGQLSRPLSPSLAHLPTDHLSLSLAAFYLLNVNAIVCYTLAIHFALQSASLGVQWSYFPK